MPPPSNVPKTLNLPNPGRLKISTPCAYQSDSGNHLKRKHSLQTKVTEQPEDQEEDTPDEEDEEGAGFEAKADGQDEEEQDEEEEETKVKLNPNYRQHTNLNRLPAHIQKQIDWGRIFGRLVDTYQDPGTIIDVGLGLENLLLIAKQKGEVADLSKFTKEELRQYASYSLALRHIPALDTYITSLTNKDEEDIVDALDQLAHYMQKGQSGARTDDTNALKTQIIYMIQHYDKVRTQDLDVRINKTRGFHHPVTGFLLSPADRDYDEVKVVIDDKTFIPGPEDWARFLYKDFGEHYNLEDPIEGLFQSKLLVDAFKCIYIGASSWDTEGKKKNRCKSKGTTANLHAVTGHSLAYIVAHVYQALDSAESHCKEGGAFDLAALYFQVVDFFEDEDFTPFADDVLKWWNKQIYPRKSSARSKQDVVPKGVSKLKLSIEARKKRRLQSTPLGNSTNSGPAVGQPIEVNPKTAQT
ncbi:hypothetical protein M422DRAFT_49067 [Sphaerobolus stellatus SS14]|uniref:Uncharacterized protein n=1 Tax=Sphaerobolus stellatus (strain SS14) TaxID=990650 RepID=A0A0C9UCC0_SPHS4|nr:hypothetical protein M422DRAFT_49067 [Sphaerobolus stellatus SS14]